MLRKLFLAQLLLIGFVFTNAGILESPSLDGDFHASRRVALRQLMPTNSVAVFFTYPIKNRSNDVDFNYKPNPDFYYLSGFNQPDAMLLIFKEEQKIDGRLSDHLLLVPPGDKNYESWNGSRMSIGEAKRTLQLTGVKTTGVIKILPVSLDAFSEVLIQYPKGNLNQGPDRKNSLNQIVNDFDQTIDKMHEKVNKTSLNKWMAQLRQVKEEVEIELLHYAIQATGYGLVEAMKAIEPGMKENQAQAIIEFHFKAAGSEYPGFPSIVGSGENACTLHYIENNNPLNETDMLVMDVGAEMKGYSADVTRTIPVNGIFSEEQKAIYELVLKAQKAGIEQCKATNSFYAPHKVAKEIIAYGLIELGIIKDMKEVKQYFMHGTSHYLGLDVHDVGTYGNLEKGMVITVEPGIYIKTGSNCDQKWWNIGVRIEDDILITDKEPKNLSGHIPKEIIDIEAIMKEESVFNQLIHPNNH